MKMLLPYILSPSKIAPAPVHLIHFLTSRCNAKCPHCFIFTENDRRFSREEMTLAEIETLAKSMGDSAYNVILTGGEIFIRKDVPQIGDAYFSNSGVQVLQILSNGYFEDAAVDCLEYLSRKWPDRQLIYITSIDDLHDAHSSYRKLKDGFNKALRTYERIRDLKRPNINLDIGLTVSHANEDRLDAIYDFLVKERGYRTLSCTLVRGNPLDPSTREVKLDNYTKFADRIAEGVRSGELDCFRDFPGADLLNAKSVLMRQEIPKIIKNGYQSPCYAARLIGVIYSNGDVYPCELLEEKKIGNLREFGGSVSALWASKKAGEIRNWIWDTHCHCTHECFATLNILFNPVFYPRLLWEYSKIKIGL